MPDILVLRGVAKAYGPVQVLQPTELAVRDGEFLTILGPSGSGKTTILRLIAGFVRPSAGRLLLQGADITDTPPHRRPFNTVFQDYALFPHMTVARNVGYGPMVRGDRPADIARRVTETLDIVGLGELRQRKPSQLSGGQRQRVALARAIVNEPRMILLDEPLGALDAGLRRQMQIFLKDLQARIRTTFVFVTHDQEEAITMSDRIVVMNHGRVAQVGAPAEIYRAPADLFVAQFFGDNNILFGHAFADGRVETAAGRLHTAPGAATGPVTVAMRPELLSFRPLDAPAIDGVVGRAIFTGPIVRVEVAAGPDGSVPLLVKVAGSDAGSVPPPGSKVRIGVPAAAVHLIAPHLIAP